MKRATTSLLHKLLRFPCRIVWVAGLLEPQPSPWAVFPTPGLGYTLTLLYTEPTHMRDAPPGIIVGVQPHTTHQRRTVLGRLDRQHHKLSSVARSQSQFSGLRNLFSPT